MQGVVILLAEEGLQPLAPSAALLPLGQQPLIDLTLSWLEKNGLSEVYLVAAAQADQLAAHVRQAGWTAGAVGGMAVHVLAAPGCHTEGEALRLVEEKDLIKGDFVLVSGGVVGNADLRPAMQAHLVRRAADRQALMTLVLHGAAPGSAAAAATAQQDACLAVLEPRSQQLLKLDHGVRSGHASLGTHMLGERNCVAMRADLRLSSVYVCAPDVLVLLSDNFDYQTVARDLVPGVLSEQELGSTLHVHELARGYVERACTVAGYLGIVDDVMSRWAYPAVPDNSGDEQNACRFNRGIYVGTSASVASSSSVSKGSLIGRGSTVDAGARLDHCVVGSDCHIGRSTTMQGACLHAHVRVDEGCTVSAAILAEHVVVRSHAKIETGALLAKRTVIDTAHCVPAGARICLTQQRVVAHGGSDDDMEWRDAGGDQDAVAEAAAAALAAGGIPEAPVGFDEQAVGPFGAGYAWAPADAPHSAAAQWASSAASDSESEAGGFTKDTPAMEDVGPEDGSPGADQFKREVAETFLRCIKEHISHDNAVIELNGLKIAEDRTFADCARYMFTTILSLCLPASQTTKPEYHALYAEAPPEPRNKEGRLELLRKVNVQLKSWKELLHRFLKSNDDQVELLLTFEEYCAEEGDFVGDNGTVFAEMFPQVVKLCYDHDLLSEEAILDWANEKEHAATEDRRFVNLCGDLLAWLEDADEESSEDSDA